MSTILVVYYTKTGTTGETAKLIADTLTAGGHSVTIKQIADLETADIEKAQSIIVGAPINGMRWHDAASALVENRQAELGTKKTAVFALSYMHGACRPFWETLIKKSVEMQASTIGALDHAIFTGRVDGRLPLPVRLMFGLRKNTPLDRTDSALVRVWAEQLSAKL